MRPAQFNPLAAITACAFVAAMLWPPISFGWPLSSEVLLAMLGLASPFAVLLVGHFFVARTWKSNLIMILLNLPLMYALQYAVAVMWYFQLGLLGAMLIGAALSTLVIGFLWLYDLSERRVRGESA